MSQDSLPSAGLDDALGEVVDEWERSAEEEARRKEEEEQGEQDDIRHVAGVMA